MFCDCYLQSFVCVLLCLTLKAPITSAVDDIFFFRENRIDISCELSAWQMIHMKFQDLFSLKKKECRLLQIFLCLVGLVYHCDHLVGEKRAADCFVFHCFITYSRTSVAPTSLGPQKCVRDMGSSSH